MSGRLHGASFFGGWTFDQLVSVQCDSVDNPNNYLGGALNPTAPVGGIAISAGATRASWTSRIDMGSSCQARTRSRGTSRSTRAFQSYAGPIRGTFWDIGATTMLRAELHWPLQTGQLVIPELVTAPTPPGR